MSSEHVIIDGYNLVFRSRRLRELVDDSLERARDELLRWLEEAYRRRPERVTLVFDGEHDPLHVSRPRRGSVRVIFSASPESADDLIRRLVDQESRRPSRKRHLACRVVSSDLEVARYARLSGGKAVGVESYLQALGRDHPPSTARESPAEASRRRQLRPTNDPGAEVTGDESKPGAGGKRELDELERLFQAGSESEDDENPD